MYILIKILFIQLLVFHFVIGGPEEDQGVKYANKCEGNYI